MLHRLITKSFGIKLCSRNNNIIFSLSKRNNSLCNQCGLRVYSSHKISALRNYCDRTLLHKKDTQLINIRYYASQDVDKTETKSDHIDKRNQNKTIDSSEKINVKLKPSELKRLLSLAEPEKWTLTGAIGLLIISSSVSMAIPFSLGMVLDIIYSGTTDLVSAREKLDSLCLMLCGVFLVGGVCNFGRVYLMSISGQRMTQALRKQVFGAIMRQEPAWFSRTSTGELVNRLSADSQLVGRNLSQNVSDGLRSLFMVGAGTGMMIYMSPSLALIGLCVVPPVSMLAVIYGRFVRGITRQLQDSLAETSELAEEKISNIKTVKTFSKENKECESYAQKIENILQLAYKESLAVGSFYGLTGLSGNTIIILVLYYGGGMVAAEQLTVGNLTSFLLYAAYVGISISGLSSFYTELNKGMGAATRLWQIIDREPMISTGGLRPKERPTGELILDNVTFSYSDAPLIKGMTLRLSPGKSIALVGRSGCGKSTVAALLLRLYDPTSGRVMLDGMDIKSLDPVWLRSHIGYVSQNLTEDAAGPTRLYKNVGGGAAGKEELSKMAFLYDDSVREPVLFSGSIKDNILYGATDEQSDEELERLWSCAARTAQLQDLIADGGWRRGVGAGGSQLSGGQKQRVAIARAILKNPKILILDEATSALDTYSEYLVDKALKEISKDRTVLTIAHRLSTIQSADEVAVIDDGAIVEQGTYKELMMKPNGYFKDLIAHQTFSAAKKTREYS